MKISIVTPTHGRPKSLEALYRLYRAQTYPDKELIIADDSPAPCPFFRDLDDPSVRYLYRPEKETLGKKRDRLVKEAAGDCIVQFDDDDYYAPGYVQFVADALRDHDFFKLTSWFGFDLRSGSLFYWETGDPSRYHFRIHPKQGSSILDTRQIPDLKDWVQSNYWGYGFSYGFRKAVYGKVQFDPGRNAGEDFDFIQRVRQQGFTIAALPDRTGLLLHVIHASNTSCVFPNFILPRFLLESLFGPAARDHLGHFDPARNP